MGRRTLPQKLGFGREYFIQMRQDENLIMDQLIEVDPHAIIAYPSHLHAVAHAFRERKNSIASLRNIITGGETLTPETRVLLEDTFGVPVRNNYANVECGPVAYQCGHGTRHVVPDTVLIDVENIDADGVGDAILTSLRQEAFPVIRYRIGDRMRVSEGRCACGVYSQQIVVLEGKEDDFIILPSGRKVSPRFFERLAGIPGILEYRIIQKARGLFRVQLSVSASFDRGSENLVRERIERGCRNENVRAEFEYLDAVPRAPSGKLQRIVSEIDCDVS